LVQFKSVICVVRWTGKEVAIVCQAQLTISDNGDHKCSKQLHLASKFQQNSEFPARKRHF